MICPTCNEECKPELEDIGYGCTEAWGIPDNDVNFVWLCSECGMEVDYEPEPIDVPDDWC